MKMIKFLVVSCALFVDNVYSMEIVPKGSFDDKQIVSCLFNKLSLNESLHAVSALVRVNKQYNQEFNDPGFTRTFMRFVGDKYEKVDCFEADIVKKLQTKGAKNYYELSEKLINVRSYHQDVDNVVEKWIQKGADVQYRKLKNFWCTCGFIECPLLFPLSNAVAQNLTTVVPLLIRHGANVGYCSATLLNMAIECKNAEIVKILLNNGIIIDHPSKGISSVARAVRCGDIPILRIFFEYGIDVDRAVEDCFGKKYPLVIAANSGNWDLMYFLYKQGAGIGVREAFDHAKYIRRFRVNDLRANKGNIRAGLVTSSREDFIAEVEEIEATMKFLLVRNKNFLLNNDVEEACKEKDRNLLHLYCECDKDINISRISREYPEMLEYPEKW